MGKPVADMAEMAARRAKLLAEVCLTRRLNVDLHDLGDGADDALDFIGTIQSDRVPGFLQFGVIVWGTPKELKDAREADAFGRSKKALGKTTYYIPVVVLLFSMHNDAGYFSWLVEPSAESNTLVEPTSLAFEPFDLKQLDRMTRRIEQWYARLSKIVAVGVGSRDASQRDDGE